jgi:hypothetical protein
MSGQINLRKLKVNKMDKKIKAISKKVKQDAKKEGKQLKALLVADKKNDKIIDKAKMKKC